MLGSDSTNRQYPLAILLGIVDQAQFQEPRGERKTGPSNFLVFLGHGGTRKGTTFRLTWPIKPQAEDVAHPIQSALSYMA